MAAPALVTAPDRIRAIVEGSTIGGATNTVPRGRFRRLGGEEVLAQQPISIFHEKPYEVTWSQRRILPATGSSTVGSLVDSQISLTVRVGYLLRVGGMVALQDEIARDELLLRLALEDPQNWDQGLSAIVELRVETGGYTPPDAEGRAFLDLAILATVYDAQPMVL